MESQEIIEKIINGVAIVTSRRGNEVNGLSIAWMSQVCFDPQLIMISIGKDRLTHEFIKESKIFVINILTEKQKDLAKLFGLKSGRKINKFQTISYETGETGAPILKNCLAYLECKVYSSHKVADRTMFIGQVIHANKKSNENPLIYNSKDYF